MSIQVGEADEQITVADAFTEESVNSFWSYTLLDFAEVCVSPVGAMPVSVGRFLPHILQALC
jgi:hypothetical protein